MNTSDEVTNLINIAVVRNGEWNEAVCYTHPKHPKTEVVAQKCKDIWNVYFVSSRSAVVISGGLSRQDAINLAGFIAKEVLSLDNPRNEIRQRYMK